VRNYINLQIPQQRQPSSASLCPYHTLRFPINISKCNYSTKYWFTRTSDTSVHNIHLMFEIRVNHKIWSTAIRPWYLHSLPQTVITVVNRLGQQTSFMFEPAHVELYALFLHPIFHHLVPLLQQILQLLRIHSTQQKNVVSVTCTSLF